MKEEPADKEKKTKKEKSIPAPKKRACKIGGLWVDSDCFPELTEEDKDPSSESR